jgi:energy-coupling factor transport system ATP-binding protein
VAIAGIIAMRPKCIVLDEPTAMLDPVGRREVLDTVRRLVLEQGITVVLITHHMSECVAADRLVVMAGGEIAEDGTPREVFAKVERLKALGLTVPATVALLYELRQRGLDLPLDALGADACAEAICGAIS